MSRLSSITVACSSDGVEVTHIVSELMQYGWSLDDHGGISYLPLGDKDSFAWEKMQLSQTEELLQIVENKEQAQEIIGVVICWEESRIGGQFLIFPANEEEGEMIKEISLILNINRRQLKDCFNLADVNWYLHRLIPPLLSSKSQIVDVRWEEHI